MSDWAEILDRFEQQLDRYERLLDDPEHPVVEDAWPPAGVATGPIPAELFERASALLVRSGELEQRLTARRDELPARHTTQRPRRPAGFGSVYTRL
ncbi:MAG: hypothetical protein AAGD35_09040 [Actinomycetota bacterium]